MPEETLRENKMGTMPENKLLLSMAVPMMISMLVQALYNIVDSIFVSRICEDALMQLAEVGTIVTRTAEHVAHAIHIRTQ